MAAIDWKYDDDDDGWNLEKWVVQYQHTSKVFKDWISFINMFSDK